MVVYVNGELREYADGIRYLDIAGEYQNQYEDEILLVHANGKLRELFKRVKDQESIQFITARQKPGQQTYQRSAVLMMLKAFYAVAGRDRIEKVLVDFSMDKGLFVRPIGTFKLDQNLIDQVKTKMYQYVEQKIPFEKRNIKTDEAILLFRKHGMYDKARLFHYRRASRVNVYSLGGFEDYYYGYMVPDTGYLKYFDLLLYDNGFLLMLPDINDTRIVPIFHHQEKIYRVLKEATEWGSCLEVADVGALNQKITEGKARELILIQEALQEKKIGQIAEAIVMHPEKKIVMISGPSSSGKTTFSHRLSIQLEALGMKPHPVAADDYFVDRENSPKDENGNYNYEILECLDVKQFNQDMTNLLAGKTVSMPTYNFKTGKREYRGNTLTLGKEDILIIEGIHCLNDRFSYALPRDNKFKIYISALTQLNIDEHNRIPTTDGRLLRRMVRDARTRGTSAQETIRMWPTVRKGEEENIFPYQEDADIVFNSALVYELAVLKQYAEPLLFGISRESEEYLEAKRLLKFFDYFLGVSSETIPNNSLVREFIGGSCFDV